MKEEEEQAKEKLWELFSSKDEFKWRLFYELGEMGWGNAIHIGRSWWLYIGCPTSFKQIESCLNDTHNVKRKNTATLLYALIPGKLSKYVNEFSGMLFKRLKVEEDEIVREAIYDALACFVKHGYSKESLLPILRERLQTENLESPVGSALLSLIAKIDNEAEKLVIEEAFSHLGVDELVKKLLELLK